MTSTSTDDGSDGAEKIGIFRKLIQLFTNPNRLMDSSRFVEFAILVAVTELVIAVYAVGLSLMKGKCFLDLINISDLPVMLPVLFGWVIFYVKTIYFFCVAYHGFYHRARKVTTESTNRTKLAMCTRGLLEAQKSRIRKTNIVFDIWVLMWILAMVIFRAKSEPGCVYWEIGAPNLMVGCATCEALSWGLLMFACSSIFAGLVIKYFIIASFHDYTIQSQKMELLLAEEKAGGQIKSPITRWFLLAEGRQVLVVKIGIVLVFWYIVGSACVFTWGFFANYLDEVGLKRVTLIITWFVRAFDTFAVILVVADGGMILLPWTAYQIFLESKNKFQAVRRERALRGRQHLAVLSLPRKKVIIALSVFVMVPYSGTLVTAHVGLVHWSAFCLIFQAVFLLIPIIFIRDMQVSMDDLLELTAESNFGLMLSRPIFVKEIAAAIVRHDNRDKNSGVSINDTDFVQDINIPTFLASQARAERCAVVSYRWMNPKNANGRPILCLKNVSCHGFDWTVSLTKQQAALLIQKLEKSPEDYVWMDQFCIPQSAPSDSVCDDEKAIVEAKKAAVRYELVQRMTGLYSCAAHVVALNDPAVDLPEIERYKNRLWCFQEYCLPRNLTLCFTDECDALKERIAVMHSRLFPSDSIKDDNDFEVQAVASETEIPIILDWLVSSEDALKHEVHERVSEIGCRYYMDLKKTIYASSRRDTLSALAQPWFGVIMTSEKTKSYMVQAMIQETLDHGEQEVEVINNSCEAECHWTGGISPDVMLSGPPLCPETGFAATEVSLTYPAAEIAPIRSCC